MTVPLTDADYAAIRARVHTGIARHRRQAVTWRLAAAAAIVLIVALVPRDDVTFPPAAPPLQPVIAAQPPLPELVEPAAPVQPVRHPPRRQRKAKEEEVTTPMRIEIDTADPEVRIIWIINPTTEEAL